MDAFKRWVLEAPISLGDFLMTVRNKVCHVRLSCAEASFVDSEAMRLGANRSDVIRALISLLWEARKSNGELTTRLERELSHYD